MKATFVGHPLIENPSGFDRTNYPHRRADDRNPVIGLLPGSRDIEIRRHLPVMIEAAASLQHRHPNIRFKLSRAAGLDTKLFDQILKQSPKPEGLSSEDGSLERLLTACDLAVAVSGTVTLQAALCGVPMIVIYRVSTLSYWIGRAMIRVPHIGLVNLVAGRQLAPELIQKEVSAPRIAAEVEKMLSDPAALIEKRQQLTDLRLQLGSSGASTRVADIALSMLK